MTVPALRFPQFRDAGDWEARKLEELGSFLSALTGKSGEDFNSGIASYVTYINVFQNTFASLNAVGRVNVNVGEKQNKVQKGDVFFTISSETPEEVGMSSVLLSEIKNCYLNSFCALFRFFKEKELNLTFAGYLFREKKARSYFSKHCQGTTRFNLSKEIFKQLPVQFPTLDEQKKIADCLRSLDDLIAAQAQKIEALKAYKKGLMQQLFPAEGETVPRLRFPVFRDAASWSEKNLGSQLRGVVRQVVMEDDQDYSLVTVKRRYGGVETRGVFKGEAIKVKSQFSIKEGDFLISKRQIVHSACGVVPKQLENFIVSNEYSVLRAKSDCDVNFFWYFSQQSRVAASFLASSRGIVIEKMLFDLDYWLKLKFMLPLLAEQQQIGRLLTSIDNLVTTNIQQLENLKTHKKGLMQGLFPVVNKASE